MKTQMKLISITALTLVIATGCSSLRTVNDNTPHLTFKGSLGGQTFSFQNPKDTDMSGFSIVVATNGTVSMTISNITTVENPTNIVDTSNGMAAIVASQGTAFVNVVNAAANAAGAIAASAAKTAAK
jgi:hypothetical protein